RRLSHQINSVIYDRPEMTGRGTRIFLLCRADGGIYLVVDPPFAVGLQSAGMMPDRLPTHVGKPIKECSGGHMKLLYHAAASLVMAAVGTSSSVAAYIAPLDGTSVESTFETGAITGMPTIGWTGGGRVFDAGNGAVINVSHPYNNYQVQFIT